MWGGGAPRPLPDSDSNPVWNITQFFFVFCQNTNNFKCGIFKYFTFGTGISFLYMPEGEVQRPVWVVQPTSYCIIIFIKIRFMLLSSDQKTSPWILVCVLHCRRIFQKFFDILLPCHFLDWWIYIYIFSCLQRFNADADTGAQFWVKYKW